MIFQTNVFSRPVPARPPTDASTHNLRRFKLAVGSPACNPYIPKDTVMVTDFWLTESAQDQDKKTYCCSFHANCNCSRYFGMSNLQHVESRRQRVYWKVRLAFLCDCLIQRASVGWPQPCWRQLC